MAIPQDHTAFREEAPRKRRDESNTLVPIETMELEPDAKRGLIAGDVETADIFLLETDLGRACVHTSKGVGYKDVNEDGGALFADEHGRFYLGVFDQAGGMGASDERGAASAIAAKRFFGHVRRLAIDEGDAETAVNAMRGAILETHRDLLERGFEEATTFLGARVDRAEAVILVVGDSGALLFRADGTPVARTRQQRLPPPLPQNILTDAVGQSSGEPTIDVYRWSLVPGDFLLLGSDGLLDAATEAEIAGILRKYPDPAKATRVLRDEVYVRMKEHQAKSDNVTIALVSLGAE
jgi:serine/threonine protein phosphatase PrpC